MDSTNPIVVAAMYRFVALPDFEALRAPLLATMQQHNVMGTLLLAPEGINGTVSGTREGIDALLAWLQTDDRFDRITVKESFTDSQPFYRCKVKLKKEIVTMGVDGIDPNNSVGRYVKPADWNALISDPDTILIDTRNEYEIQIGSFDGAINPETETFRQFPAYAEEHRAELEGKKIAMFCTGGIRCEKSTALMRGLGFDDVYHLEGGILKYLEDVPRSESMWHGECFVFDNRVAVDHDLQPGSYDQCYACRRPITEADKSHEHYEKGVSCHHCHDLTDEDKRARLREREHQVQLALQRGESHIGNNVQSTIEQRRAQKQAHKEAQRMQG